MTEELPLSGKRILVTRSRQQAGRLAEALEALGAEVLRLPTIEIVPPETYTHLDAALEGISSFDWLIVTSANGAEAIAARMNSLRISADQLKHLSVAAVGSATAAAMGRIGLEIAAMPDEYVAEALVAMLSDRVAGRRILLVRAAVARDVIPDELRKRAADVKVVDAYRTVIPVDSIARVRDLFSEGLHRPQAVTFTSSSTVNNFLSLLSAAGMEPAPDLLAISIGPITSRTLRQHHWEPAAEASSYNIPGLVEACVRRLAPSGG